MFRLQRACAAFVNAWGGSEIKRQMSRHIWRGGRESPLLERTDGGLIAAGPGATQAASKAKSIDGSIRSNVQPVLGRNQGLEVT